MNADSIVLIATKATVVALHRDTGARLWQTPLESSWTGDFVSLTADSRRVFAHTRGKVFCLDLFTGRLLWSDGLSGLGYGLASLALPGTPQATFSVQAAELARRQQAGAGSAPGQGHAG